MDAVTIKKAIAAPRPSPSAAKASQELLRMPLTEACVSGLCDFCLYRETCVLTVRPPGDDRTCQESNKKT